jgi:hypothetical protein
MTVLDAITLLYRPFVAVDRFEGGRPARQARLTRGTQLYSWAIDGFSVRSATTGARIGYATRSFRSDILKHDFWVGSHVAGIRPRIEYKQIRFTYIDYTTVVYRC